jgi:hypothetical protein
MSRLQGTVRRIRSILERNGHVISEENGYLVLEDFFEWFHKDIFMYHASAIGEFLNNIRWEIWRYLQPAMEAAYRVRPGPMQYTFEAPPELSGGLPRGMYYHLMSKTLRQPNFPEFTVTEILKGRY